MNTYVLHEFFFVIFLRQKVLEKKTKKERKEIFEHIIFVDSFCIQLRINFDINCLTEEEKSTNSKNYLSCCWLLVLWAEKVSLKGDKKINLLKI